jgi:hypothetical protein
MTFDINNMMFATLSTSIFDLRGAQDSKGITLSFKIKINIYLKKVTDENIPSYIVQIAYLNFECRLLNNI